MCDPNQDVFLNLTKLREYNESPVGLLLERFNGPATVVVVRGFVGIEVADHCGGAGPMVYSLTMSCM